MPQPVDDLHGPEDRSQLSDGFHTFDELYAHRNALTAALYARWPYESRWKTRRHSPGDRKMFPGYFLVGIHLPTGLVTYHVPATLWDTFGGPEAEHAPPWDGHMSGDVVARLTAYAAMHAEDE